jgi:hypothetical protein
MKRTVVVGAVVLVLLSSAVALAAIPSAEGTIHGCRDNRSGVLRVIDAEAGQTCTTKETALTWNQQGQPGPIGPAGPQGPAGPAGQNGVSGHEVVFTAFTALANDRTTAAVGCPSGKKVVGGGYTTSGADADVEVTDSAPQHPHWTAWVVGVRNGTSANVFSQIFAICVTA